MTMHDDSDDVPSNGYQRRDVFNPQLVNKLSGHFKEIIEAIGEESRARRAETLS
jgi:hypothetical protein